MGSKPSYAELERLVTDLTSENTRLKKTIAPSTNIIHSSPPSTSTSSQNSATSSLVLNLQIIIDSLPQHIFWKDRSSRYLGCNRLFSEVAGLKEPSDVIGLLDYDLPWKKEEAEFFRQWDERVMSCGQAEYNIIEPQQTARGLQTWLNTNKIPLHNSAGKVIGILGTYEDITSRIKAEEMLRNYETITAAIDDLVAIVDRNHTYKAVNEAHYHAYGVQKEEIIGRSVVELIGTTDYEEVVRDKIDQALEGETIVYEAWRDFPEWGRKYLHISYFPLFDDQTKEVVGVVTKDRDMTQNKTLSTQLQHARKMEAIGRLAGGIAHDFNNILSIINGYSELCLKKMEDDHQCIPYVDMIVESGLRAVRLTDQLLAFSRRQTNQPERVNLVQELSKVDQMLTRLLGDNIEIESCQNEMIWDTKLDRSQFEQIIMNLAINARDAMAEGGKLIIDFGNISNQESCATEHGIEVPGEYVMMTITDNGTGMSPDIQQLVLEPFFTTKENSQGTGLGLSTVYGIVKQNDGYISLDSKEGRGSSFKLYFPRCTEGEDTGSSRCEEEQGSIEETGKETILLVENDYALRQICMEILANLGYNVIEASNGEEAIEVFDNFHGTIDLLLTDVIMPSLGGLETARIISEKAPSLIVIFMSGYGEDKIVGHSVPEGKVHFLPKPISSKSLAKAVRMALG
jgi:two-component system cell cycle sensor histidine kinase/response regulator CckA